MKATARLVALATLVVISGCTGGLRHKERPLREPVRLPSAPSLDPTISAPSSPLTSPVNQSLPPMSPAASSLPAVPK